MQNKKDAIWIICLEYILIIHYFNEWSRCNFSVQNNLNPKLWSEGKIDGPYLEIVIDTFTSQTD